VAFPKHSNALAYVHDLVLSLRRNLGTLPPDAAEALDALAAIYCGSGATTDLADVFRDAIPPVRRESGFHVVPHARQSASAAAPAVEDGVPDLVRVVTPRGAFAICFPDFENKVWVRLRGEIEPSLVDQLLRAEGLPVRGHDIEAFRECLRPWTKVVWAVNDLAPGGAANALIETCGEPARRRGRRRQLDPKDERPDERAFLVRRNRWRCMDVSLGTLEGVEAALLARFGKPVRAKRSG
jgi:hypothetical protein